MSYIGTPPKDVRSFGKAQFDFTATQGQTVFTGADDDSKTLGFTEGQIQVHVNGVLLDGSDYSTSNNNTVTLSAAANANDVLTVLALQTDIPNSDYVPISGGTFSGDVTVTGSFTSQGIDDNANATAITIDASENVGIGTSSPQESLHVYGTGTQRLEVETTQVANSAILKLTSTAGSYGVISDGSDALTFYDYGPAAERMRIDSSGILLVGKTAAESTTAGTYIGNGQISSVRAGTPAILNRLTSDGNILDLRKDGTAVGSISTGGNNLTIDGTYTTTKAGLGIGGSKIVPRKGQVDNDNGVDLGSETYRFKDIFLSGGAYLGGTTQDNKLNDYEEGTWTPTVRGQTTTGSYTYAENQGHYTKVGNLVTAWFNISNVTTVTTGSGTLRINNLPFSASWMSGFNGEGVGSLMISSFTGIDGAFVSPKVGENVDYILFYHTSGTDNINASVNITHKAADAADLRGFVTYRTA